MSTIKLSPFHQIRQLPGGDLEIKSHAYPWGRLAGTSDALALRLAFDRLLELSWIPVTERMPTEEDINEHGDVEWSDGEEIWEGLYSRNDKGATHWRRIVLP